MERLTCPSCGEPYNGKRCRACLYEQFTKEIAHGNHTHEGEPLVIDAPVRRPIRRKDPFGCEKKTRKPKKRLGAAIGAIVLSLWVPIFQFIVGVVTEVADAFSYESAEPEPDIARPEDALLLAGREDLHIYADWREEQEYTGDIRFFMENLTGYDLTASARDIIVNGCMMESAYLYCEAGEDSTGVGYLRLPQEDLAQAGIQTVEQISFLLEVWEDDSYDTVLETGQITLFARPVEGAASTPPEGQLLYDADGITVSFLGYREDEYYPGEVCEGTLLFHIENNTDRYLQVYSAETVLGSESVDTALWCQLYPGTRAVSTMYLYTLEDMGFTSPDDLFPAQVVLEITDRDDYDFLITTGGLALDRE